MVNQFQTNDLRFYDEGSIHFDSQSTKSYDENKSNENQEQQQEKYSEERHLIIQIRNARERNRIFEINEAFARLRQVVPYTNNRTKRISKVKTLEKARQYITELENQLWKSTKRVT